MGKFTERLDEEKVNNQGLLMKIVKYNSANEIKVLFIESNSIIKCRYRQFNIGTLQDSKGINKRLGEENINYQGLLMKIIEYNSANEIKVLFPTGESIWTKYDNFKKGTIKDHLTKNVYNIGYIGVGQYKSEINNKKSKAYSAWHGMIERCYDPLFLNKYPTYIDATVCKEWHNFQNFAKWFDENYYEIPGEKMNLDKDLVERGSKIYCPEMCNFVPSEINVLLIKSDADRGEYPIGVTFRKRTQMYAAQLSVNGTRKHLGFFDTPESAFYCYKEAKEKYIKLKANKYKEWLPAKVYTYLMNYLVEITD